MSAKHSPGPWRWGTTIAGNRALMDPTEDVPIAWADVASEADARLIAAAPELLAELRERVKRCGDCRGLRTGRDCSNCEASNALIRRIEEGP